MPPGYRANSRCTHPRLRKPRFEEFHANLHLGRNRDTRGVNRPHIRLLKIRWQDRHQHPALDFPANIPGRAQDDAVAVDSPLADDFTVIGRQRPAHLDGHQTIRPLQLPAPKILIALADRDAPMVLQIGQRLGHAEAFDIRWCGTQHPAIAGDTPLDDIALPYMTEADIELKPLLNQIDPTIEKLDLNLQLRKLPGHRRQSGGQTAAAETRAAAY